MRLGNAQNQKHQTSKQNKMKSIQELNQIMCEAMGVSIAKYNAMDLSGQNKLRQSYLKKFHNLKTRKS